MHIIIFTHPDFKNSQSMPRFARMLAEGMRKRDHSVELWSAKRFFYRLPIKGAVKKWLGYLDQYFLFPLNLIRKLRRIPSGTLFVFADQALGPWMPLLSSRPFIVHCHDFLAQRSALGEIAENKPGITGRIYQDLIRRGYKKGKNFISVSQKTREDLHRFLNADPENSRVIYNGLNQDFRPGNPEAVRQLLEERFNVDLKNGYILHVGGNQFYKNRKGVLKIYCAWRRHAQTALPLLMIGSTPTNELYRLKVGSPYSRDIHFLSGVSDELLKLCYQGATAFLFPSLEEGFGWPIAEAMASGCPVITTAEPPMTEVGKKSCYYIPRLPVVNGTEDKWAEFCAGVLERLVQLPANERQDLVDLGIENAKRFNTEKALEDIESFYQDVLLNFKK